MKYCRNICSDGVEQIDWWDKVIWKVKQIHFNLSDENNVILKMADDENENWRDADDEDGAILIEGCVLPLYFFVEGNCWGEL